MLMRLPQVIEFTGLPRSTIYARIKEGTFPPPVKLSARSVAWPKTVLEEWEKLTTAGEYDPEQVAEGGAA